MNYAHRKIKVLFLLPSLAGGGAERVFVNLMNHLSREQFEIALGVFRFEGPYTINLREDINVHDLKTHLAWALPKIASLISRQKPDIVYSTLSVVNLAVGLVRPFFRNLPMKFLAREDNLPSLRRKDNHAITYWHFWYRLVYRGFDAVICQSGDMLADVSRAYYLSPAKMVKISNPVVFEEVERLCAYDSTPFENNNVNLVAAGRLTSQKGFDLLLESLVHLENARVHLHVLGDGPMRPELEHMTNELGLSSCVTFYGHQMNPYRFMKYADMFILSSRYEGFPNVLLEALACGCPGVAFACPGGITEIIKPGFNGYTVEPGDLSGMAAAMLKVLSSRFDRDAIAADIKTRFSIETILPQYNGLFWDVLQTKIIPTNQDN